MFANKRIRCVVVHDHVLLRQGLRRLLEDEADMEVVAEAGTAVEALQSVFAHGPDVVIADAAVFSVAADQVKALVEQGSPQSRVLFLGSWENDDATPHPSRAEGNYLARRTSAQELVEMVRRIYFARVGGRESAGRARAEWGAEGSKGALTGREREVLKLLAEGGTVRSVAAVLGLSIKTVDAHKFNLMRKLGIHNKAELVMWAVQKRVVKVPANF